MAVTWRASSSRPKKVYARSAFIAHKVFSTSFCKSQFPHKSVNLFFILAIVKDTLTDLWES